MENNTLKKYKPMLKNIFYKNALGLGEIVSADFDVMTKSKKNHKAKSFIINESFYFYYFGKKHFICFSLLKDNDSDNIVIFLYEKDILNRPKKNKYDFYRKEPLYNIKNFEINHSYFLFLHLIDIFQYNLKTALIRDIIIQKRNRGMLNNMQYLNNFEYNYQELFFKYFFYKNIYELHNVIISDSELDFLFENVRELFFNSIDNNKIFEMVKNIVLDDGHVTKNTLEYIELLHSS
tara:strand:+ start:18340 stop:19044 length:705 start_codon:yes stop_codon:yes gene_type:complete